MPVAAVVLAVAVAGCTAGGPDPVTSSSATSAAPTPTLSPSAAASPTVSVAAPQRPSEMDRTDESGARAAAVYFVNLYSYVLVTGDTAEWDSMTWETCTFCARIREIAISIQSDGASTVGGDLTVYDIAVAHDDLLDGYPVRVGFAQEPATRIRADGTVAKEMPRNSGHVQVDMKWVDTGWKVLEVATVDGAQP